jgi:hypothetical protein
LQERPTVAADLFTVFSSYLTLSRGRSYSAFGSPTPIAFGDIDRYAMRLQITSLDEFERFVYLITSLDSVYFRVNREIDEAKKKRKENA